MFNRVIKGVTIAATAILTANSFAGSVPFSENLQISAAGGLSWFHANNTSLQVSSAETDSVSVNSISSNITGRIGVGYNFCLIPYTHKQNFFHTLLTELNVYYSSGNIRGDVDQFSLPIFQNYSYKAQFNSLRVMFDFKPMITTYYSISPYPILGLGVSFNDISYRESAIVYGVNPASAYSLPRNQSTTFTYNLGAGLKLAITREWSANLEYIYNYIGNLQPGKSVNIGQTLAKPPTFTLSSNSFMLGVTYRMEEYQNPRYLPTVYRSNYDPNMFKNVAHYD